MKPFLLCLGVLVPWWCFAQGPQNVLIVVNENSPDSQAIARYYATKRNIPNICTIRTMDTETISKSTFEREILQPIATYLKSKNLQDQILYIVTTRGLPLVVEGTDGPTGDLATVDSKLALLYDYMIWGNRLTQGKVENPYFTPDFHKADFRPFTRAGYDIYLVTRLTDVSLVDRALQSSTGGAYYFDLTSSRPSTESDWLQEATTFLKDAGLSVTFDTSSKVQDNLINVQGFVNEGGPSPKIQWTAGSIANLLGSATVSTAPDYVKSGVSGFIGYVKDPTPGGYVRPQVLFPSYAAGYNFAEACYAAARYINWRQELIGDPLASPYASNSASRRESVSGSPIDKETGLPEYFAKRRQLHLTRKYDTSKEAVVLLLKAENALARGDAAAAASLVDKSLEQDSRLPDSKLLKAALLGSTVLPQSTNASPPVATTITLPEPPKSPLATPARNASQVREESTSSPARVLNATPIAYPKRQGVVEVDLLIDEMGQLMKVEIVRGDPKLANEITKAVRGWTFRPAIENGRAVPSKLTLPLPFTPDPSKSQK